MATRQTVHPAEEKLRAARARFAANRAAAASAAGRQGPLVGALIIGVGLVAAPFIFQMLGGDNRALKGNDMMNNFAPYMQESRLNNFEGYLATMDRAEQEVRTKLVPATEGAAAQTGGQEAVDAIGVAQKLTTVWQGDGEKVGMFKDMSGMVDDIQGNLDNFRAVRALPPFWMFPGFFILPGLIIAVLAGVALSRAGRGAPVGAPRKALVVMGVGLIAAPFIFQMMGGENRAFEGAAMIDDFKPIMTQEKVRLIQIEYFPAVAEAESRVRTALVPVAVKQGTGDFPAMAAWSRQWPEIQREFAAFLGAMSDNLDNYRAVKSLPPFSLFPFFFILPGLLVAGLAVAAGRSRSGSSAGR